MATVTQISKEKYKVVWREWIPAPDTLTFMLTLEAEDGHRIYADVPYEMYMITVPGDSVMCTNTGEGTARFELIQGSRIAT